MEKIIQTVSAGVGVIIGFMFGDLDGIFYALLAFMIIDYISGVVVAIANKKLSSSVGFKGICKKMLILLIVAIANIIDTRLMNDGSVFKTASAMFYIANEGISILENSARLGVPYPKKLKNILIQLNEEEESEDIWKKSI